MTRLLLFRMRTALCTVLCIIITHSIFGQCVSSIGSKITVACNVDTATIAKPTAISMMNCGTVTAIQLMLPTQVIMDSCGGPCFARMIRQWKLTVTGMVNPVNYFDTICFTQIILPKLMGSTIKCPKDTLIICTSMSSVDTSVSALGSPLKAQGIPCNILQLGPVTTVWPGTFNSKGCYHFIRTWSLLDWCTKDTTSCIQKVEVQDKVAPTISVSHSLIKSSVSSDVCTGAIIFPAAVVHDNCTPDAEILVTINIVGTGLSINTNGGVINNIPQGMFKAIYTANDGCNNTAMDSVNIEIFDGQAPIAICKGPKVIQLNDPIGMVVLPDYAFDDGSFDRCSDIKTHISHFIKVKRMLSAPKCVVKSYDALLDNPLNRFADQVKFCCADHNTDVMVILRVYQDWTIDGPVSNDDYPIYSECMISVKVIDKAGPSITCPPGITIECRDIAKHRIKDPNDVLYGAAAISDMCPDTNIIIDSISHLDACNVGNLIRRITAKDQAGNPSSCDQTIKVINSFPFNANDTSDWEWPKDTTFFVCSANTSTAITGLPKLKDPACTKVAYTSEDEVYEFATGACKKIIRRWKVIDWCQISPSEPYAGKWSHLQLIVVMDTIKPVLSVPANFIVNNLDSLCAPTLVTVPLPTATDCTPSVSLDWKYSLDLFSDGLNPINGIGKSVSQLMPNGVHILTFYVNDQCGNTSSKSTTITVKDGKKPTPVAINGLATDLSLMNGVAMARVFAKLYFVPGSVLDNCSPYSKLKFSYSANVNDSLRIYTCDSIGNKTVQLWVTDEAGNQDRVTSHISIQNNMGACTSPAANPIPELRKVGIGGNLITESNKPVEQAIVKIMQGDIQLSDPSINSGKYSTPGLYLGQSYDIIPKKDINPLNGVSTVDLIMMQKHILGISPIQSPYKLIAADIDRNGEINGIDLLELRKILLGIDRHFSNNESWRFVDALYKFNSLTTALNEPFKEKYSIRELSNSMEINFVGIKIGDLNESSQSSELNSLEIREKNNQEWIIIQDQSFKENEIVKVSIQGDKLSLISGFQLSFQNKDLEFLNIQSGLFNLNEVFANDLNGKIYLNGFSSNALKTDKGSTWFSLVFRSKKAGSLSNSINLISKPEFKSEVYNDQLSVSNIELKWSANFKTNFKLEQNSPNPFSNTTTIKYILPLESWVNLKIFDLDGKMLYNSKVFGQKGQNDWIVDRSHFNTSGIYYYKVETPFGTGTNKMILFQ